MRRLAVAVMALAAVSCGGAESSSTLDVEEVTTTSRLTTTSTQLTTTTAPSTTAQTTMTAAEGLLTASTFAVPFEMVATSGPVFKANSLSNGLIDFRDGLVARNVASLAPGPRMDKKPGRTLTPEESRMLLAAARLDRLEAAWVTMLACGLRRFEMLGLSWADVNFDAGTLTVRRSLLRAKGRLVLDRPRQQDPGALFTYRPSCSTCCAGIVRGKQPSASRLAKVGWTPGWLLPAK